MVGPRRAPGDAKLTGPARSAVIALTRYIAACCLHAQRWVAPGLLFVLSVVITFATGGPALSTLGEGATWLFPVTAWLTVVTLNDEDPSQAAISAAAGGGIGRVRNAKLAVAGCVGLVMTAISLAVAYANSSSSFTLDDLAAGTVACLFTVAGGVALGSLCARPLVSRTGWAVLAIIVLTIVDLIVPHAPPARVVLEALSDSHDSHLWASLARGAPEVIVLAVVFIGASNYLSRARS